MRKVKIIGFDTETVLTKSTEQVPLNLKREHMPKKIEITKRAMEIFMQEHYENPITPEDYELKEGGYLEKARIELMFRPSFEGAFEEKPFFSYNFLSAQFYSPEFGFNDFVTDFLKLKDYFVPNTRTSIFLAQNAEYDFSVLRKTLKDNNFVFRCLFNKGRFIYGKLVKNEHTFKIWDLKNIFTGWSLKKTGNFIGLPKLEPPEYLGKRKPETKKEWNYLRKYAMRDAEICYKAGKWVFDKLGDFRMTLPSLSFNVYDQKFKPYGAYLTTNEATERKLRLAYKGGRTECFVRGSPFETVYVYDAISLYPYIMKKFEMPLGIGELKQKQTVDLSKEGIAHCYIQQDAEIPILALRMFAKDGTYKLIFPNGKFSSWFTYPELRYLEFRGLGKILKVYEAFEVERSELFFKNFINYYFRLKQTDKEGSDFWKLFMNSLYGKFAQDVTSLEMDVNPDGSLEIPKYHSKRMSFIHKNIIAASYITARAKLHMHGKYEANGSDNLVYTDTDSIHTFKPISGLGHNLGDLDFKGKTDNPQRATYIRSKFYIFNNVLKCRGLQYVLKADEMRKLVEIGDVQVLTTILLRVRSAFRRHQELLSETEMIKHFTLTDDGKRDYEKALFDKRLLTEWCKSKPRVLNVLQEI